MLESILGFLTFLILVFVIIKSANKNREAQYKILIENIKLETEFYIEQAKCSGFTIGLGKNNFLFNRCDLYLTQKALVILAFKKDSYFKELSQPIILTNDINDFSARFPFAYVKKVNKINFESDIVKFHFGEKEFTKTEVFLKLKSLNETEINKIKQLAEENF